MNNSVNQKTNLLSQAMKMVTNMNDNFSAMFLFIILILIVIFILIYYFYMRNLLSRECTFMDNIYGSVDGYIKSLNENDPNCQNTLKDYYVKTAYNCCSGGSYKNDYVSTCVLKDLLKQGIRGLDFEIYSINDVPVVATSTEDSFYIKETYNYVGFDEIMNIIINYAFANGTAPNSKDPILFHLRIRSNNQSMYTNLAKIFKQYDSYFLGPEYSFENNGNNIGDKKIMELSNKIIVIVDKINNAFMENTDFYEYVNLTSNSMFMRALRYYDIKNTPDLVELQNYNKKNMSIAMPDKGSNPENMSAIVCREAGCQMIAMRYQTVDTNLQENIMFFDNAGYAFVLKPDRLRYFPTIIPNPTPQNPALSYQTRTVQSDYYKFDI